jgi:Interferon-related developmental regulator (IFRD)
MSRLQKKLGRSRLGGSRRGTPQGTPRATDDENDSDTSNMSTVSIDSDDSSFGELIRDRQEKKFSEELRDEASWKSGLLANVDVMLERKTAWNSPAGRERSLKHFVEVYRLKVGKADLFEGREEEVVSTFNRSIRLAKSNKEITYSAKALSLLAGTIPESMDLSKLSLPVLKEAITRGGHETAIPYLIYAATSIAFFSSEFFLADILSMMEFLAAIIESDGKSIEQVDNHAAITAALDGWGVLLGLLDEPAEIVQATIPSVIKCLESPDLGIRLSAGEVIALAYERSQGYEDGEPSGSFVPYDSLSELTSRLSALANISSKKISKQSKREQHSVFRDVVSTVANSQPPSSQSFRITKGERLAVYTWEHILRLKHIRRIFAGGLHAHLARNNLVRQALDLPPVYMDPDSGTATSSSGSETDSSVSKREKTQSYKDARKSRNENIQKDRRRRGEARMAELFPEEGEY